MTEFRHKSIVIRCLLLAEKCKNTFKVLFHESLLLKLKGYGIEGSLLQWFRNFLTNRQQRVVVRGTFSSWTHVRSGVPRGPILVPILFLIYVNDMQSNTSSSIKMFADDTKVYREITDFENDTRALQRTLLVWWTGQLSVSLGSTQRNPKRDAHNSQPWQVGSSPYTVGSRITPVKCTKDLGVLYSSDLS